MGITQSISEFLIGKDEVKGRTPTGRYTSFDYCYNYFYSFYKSNNLSDLANNSNIEKSCLELSFYLASWGMFRGSSFLLQENAKSFQPVIKYISSANPKLWDIDVDVYDDQNIALLLNCKGGLIKALGNTNDPSDTLVTKIMLGVFGNTPAFDRYFKKCFGFSSFNKSSLKKINSFYYNNKFEIDSIKISTLDFLSSKETTNLYTKAKIIDSYGFINGQK